MLWFRQTSESASARRSTSDVSGYPHLPAHEPASTELSMPGEFCCSAAQFLTEKPWDSDRKQLTGILLRLHLMRTYGEVSSDQYAHGRVPA